MDDAEQRLAWLQECPGLGPKALGSIVETFQGTLPEGFFGRPAAWYRARCGLPARSAAALAAHPVAIPPWAAFDRFPLHLLTRFSRAYPAPLARMGVPPTLVWALGRGLNELTNGNISLICSAESDETVRETARFALEAAIRQGWRVVAGHNRPVYQWAHLAAKRAGASSLLVLDRGLISAFGEDLSRDPIAPARIWGYGFDLRHSAALSPFRLCDPWIGANARYRDAMIVSLSEVVVAMGIREGGTMHRLCRDALLRGQGIYADSASLPLLEDLGAGAWTGELPDPASWAAASRGTPADEGKPAGPENG